MLFFSKKKKDVLGILKDKNDITYELIRINEDKVSLFKGKEEIHPWIISNLNLDLSKSSYEEVYLFMTHCLSNSADINRCLYRMKFPKDIIMDIWNGIHKDKGILRQSILVYQSVSEIPGFIETLSEEEKWTYFTQNQFRTVENMKQYLSMYQEIVANVLNKYLSSEGIEKYEQIYGDWKNLMEETFKEFYSDKNGESNKYMQASVDMALQMNKKELMEKKSSLIILQESVKKLDSQYDTSTLSEKYKIEEKVKELIKQEEIMIEEIQELEEKDKRIISFFAS